MKFQLMMISAIVFNYYKMNKIISQIREKFPEILLKLKEIKHKSDPLNKLNLTNTQKEVLKKSKESDYFVKNYKTGSWASSDSVESLKEKISNIKTDKALKMSRYTIKQNNIMILLAIIAILIPIIIFLFNTSNNKIESVNGSGLNSVNISIMKKDSTNIESIKNKKDTSKIYLWNNKYKTENILPTNRDTVKKFLTK